MAGKSTSLNTILIDQMAKVLSFLTVLHKRAIAKASFETRNSEDSIFIIKKGENYKEALSQLQEVNTSYQWFQQFII